MTRIWRCQTCRATKAKVTPLLDPHYGYGRCLACGKDRIFRVHDEPDEGEALRDAGMDSATSHAKSGVDSAWRARAEQVARELAATGREFTQDDITDRVGLPTVRNATGGLLSGLSRQGIIERVGDVKGSRDTQHARRISVWRGIAKELFPAA